MSSFGISLLFMSQLFIIIMYDRFLVVTEALSLNNSKANITYLSIFLYVVNTPPLLLAQKGIDWRVQCEHHKIQVFKSPENDTNTSHRYKIDHNRALKGMCDCLMAVQVL